MKEADLDQKWALILGGSSGFGLATAKKLASKGISICIVHRDRKGSMAEIEKEFEEIRQHGVSLKTFNVNALDSAQRKDVIEALALELGDKGKIQLMMHSIALGSLKLIVPEVDKKNTATKTLAQRIDIEEETLQNQADTLFDEGTHALSGIASPAKYSSELLLDDDSVASTVYSMGTSLLSWTQGVWKAQLFAPDSVVIGLTSEGNEIAWKGYAAVSAAKGALECISRSIAVEYAPHGIRCNLLQPGITDTPALKLIPGSQYLKASALRRNPMGRLTQPEDVANVVYLLSRKEGSWINGALIRVDGGEHISGLEQ